MDLATVHRLNNSLSRSQMEMMSVTYMITSSMSILGAGSIVIVAVAKKKVCNPEVHPIFHLCLADLVASVLLLSGSVLYYRNVPNLPGHKKPPYCPYVTALTSSCFMSTFLLTLTYGCEVYFKIKGRLTRRSLSNETVHGNFPVRFLFYTVSWLLPITVTLCLFAVDSGENGTLSLNDDICATCLPVFHFEIGRNCNPDGFDSSEPNWNGIYKLFFVFVLCLSMLSMVIIYVLVVRIFRKSQNVGGIIARRQYDQEREVKKWSSLYQITFCICWLPSFILGCISLSGHFKMGDYFVMYMIQASISPLQGFINCIIYGWRRRGFIRAFRPDTNTYLHSDSSIENPYR